MPKNIPPPVQQGYTNAGHQGTVKHQTFKGSKVVPEDESPEAPKLKLQFPQPPKDS